MVYITGSGTAEDTAHSTGDSGVVILGVRNDAGTSMVSADGDYGILQTDEDGGLRVAVSQLPAASQFAEEPVVQRTQVIELKSTYGLSNLRDVQTVTGTGAISNTIATDAEYLLSTGATASSYAILESAERGRYVPGFSGQIGIGVRVPTAATNNDIGRWGLFELDSGSLPDVKNGFYFEQTSSGMSVKVMRNGTLVEDVAQASWNHDTVDGSGPSGLTLDPARGNIYQVDFTWYGYGTIEFIINLPDSNSRNRRILVHRYSPDGQTSVLNPNLPITALSLNGATAQDYDLYVAGRQYSILGKYEPNRRVTSVFRENLDNVSSTVLPVICARRKTNYESVSVKVEAIEFISTKDLIVEVRTGVEAGTELTGESFGTPTNTTAGETALEVDNQATSMTTGAGEMVYAGLIPGGTNNRATLGQLKFDFDLIGTDVLCICIRKVSTEADASNVVCCVRFREEW